MSVSSDQSASCSSLHGALPHPYNQTHAGGRQYCQHSGEERCSRQVDRSSLRAGHTSHKLKMDMWAHTCSNSRRQNKLLSPISHGRNWKTHAFLKRLWLYNYICENSLQRRSHGNQINCLSQTIWKPESGEKTFSWNSCARAACRAEYSGLIILNEVISQMDHIWVFTILASNCYKIILAVVALSPFTKKPNSVSWVQHFPISHRWYKPGEASCRTDFEGTSIAAVMLAQDESHM